MMTRRGILLSPAALSSAAFQSSGKEVVVSSSNGLRACDKTLELIRGGADTLDAIVAGEANPGWLVLGAVVNDQELPLEFADRVRQAVASVDLASLYKREKGLAIVAATFVSQQGGDSALRSWLTCEPRWSL